MRRDQQIVRPDGPTALHERLANLSIMNTRIRIERQDIEIEAEGFELPGILVDASRVGDAEAKLRVRNRGNTYASRVRIEFFS